MPRNPKLDPLFDRAKLWKDEAAALREILLGCGLTEALKWRSPCYVHEGKNVCIVQRMKDFLSLLFFGGGLLKDPDHLLEPQGPGSRVGYRMRFTSVRDVERAAGSIAAYIEEAIGIAESGRRVEMPAEVELPEELTARFADDPEYEAAFERLTPGRKRGYALHFAAAKQSKTRAARIERFRPKILAGKGYLDR